MRHFVILAAISSSFEAWRLGGFARTPDVFTGSRARRSHNRDAVGIGVGMGPRVVLVGEGVLSPLPGLGFHGGMEPSAHALGYFLPALRACGAGLGTGLRCLGGASPVVEGRLDGFAGFPADGFVGFRVGAGIFGGEV